ncbi:uncharacterized protein LOC144199111 [Stigmatopora nigra]
MRLESGVFATPTVNSPPFPVAKIIMATINRYRQYRRSGHRSGHQSACNDGNRPYESSNTPYDDDQSHETSHKCGLDGLSVQPPTFVTLQLVQAEIHAAEGDLLSGLLTPGPAGNQPPVAGHAAAHAQPQILLTPGGAQVLDDHGRDGPVEGGGEKSSPVVVGGVNENVALEAKAAGGRVLGGFARPLGHTRVQARVGQEPVGGVDGGQQQHVFVAPAPASLHKSGHCDQCQQQGRTGIQHGPGRVAPARMVRGKNRWRFLTTPIRMERFSSLPDCCEWERPMAVTCARAPSLLRLSSSSSNCVLLLPSHIFSPKAIQPNQNEKKEGRGTYNRFHFLNIFWPSFINTELSFFELNTGQNEVEPMCYQEHIVLPFAGSQDEQAFVACGWPTSTLCWIRHH